MALQAPISVYTSGKGSSAAGLTATVVKDNSGEFFLEVCLALLAPTTCAASAHTSPTPSTHYATFSLSDYCMPAVVC